MLKIDNDLKNIIFKLQYLNNISFKYTDYFGNLNYYFKRLYDLDKDLKFFKKDNCSQEKIQKLLIDRISYIIFVLEKIKYKADYFNIVLLCYEKLNDFINKNKKQYDLSNKTINKYLKNILMKEIKEDCEVIDEKIFEEIFFELNFNNKKE